MANKSRRSGRYFSASCLMNRLIPADMILWVSGDSKSVVSGQNINSVLLCSLNRYLFLLCVCMAIVKFRVSSKVPGRNILSFLRTYIFRMFSLFLFMDCVICA